MVNLTGKRLFFQLLHTAHILKEKQLFDSLIRKVYLIGMMKAMEINREDLEMADDSRDYLRHVASGQGHI